MSKTPNWVWGLALLFAACSPAAKPIVKIQVPADVRQYNEGDDLVVHSSAADNKGIVRVELAVDNVITRVDQLAVPQQFVDLDQTWKTVAGTHLITVRAFNADNVASEPAHLNISVFAAITRVPSPAAATPLPLPSALAVTPQPGACTNNVALVAHGTLPDGTTVAPNQALDKAWQIQNTGTCAWSTNYHIVYAGGEAMSSGTAFPLPATAAGALTELHVALVAPATLGAHAGQWRLKDPDGNLFGPALNVAVTVSSNTPIPTTAPVLSVTAVSAGVTPANFTGNCPAAYNFAGTVTTTQAGTVTYRWLASNQSPSAILIYNAPAAGTYNLPGYPVSITGRGSFWMQLTAVTPNALASSQISFSNNCVDPKPAPPQAAILQPGSGYAGLVNQTIHTQFQGTSTGEVSSIALYANGILLSRQASRSPLHQLQGTFAWTPNAAATYDLWVVAADIFGQQTTSPHISVLVRQPTPSPTPRPTSTRVPTATPARVYVTGNWSAGKYLLDLNEAIGCMSANCGLSGRWIEQTAGAPEIVDITGSINGTAVSITIPGTLPGAPTRTFSGTVSGNGSSISGRLSTGESLTFTK